MGANRPARDPSSVPLGLRTAARCYARGLRGALVSEASASCHVAGTGPLQAAGLPARGGGIPRGRARRLGGTSVPLTRCPRETNLRKTRVLFSSASAERGLGKAPADAGIRTVTVFILPTTPAGRRGSSQCHLRVNLKLGEVCASTRAAGGPTGSPGHIRALHSPPSRLGRTRRRRDQAPSCRRPGFQCKTPSGSKRR